MRLSPVSPSKTCPKSASTRLCKHVAMPTVCISFKIMCFTVEMQHDGELKYFKDMASYIKKHIEEQEKGTSGWHVIVGK